MDEPVRTNETTLTEGKALLNSTYARVFRLPMRWARRKSSPKRRAMHVRMKKRSLKAQRQGCVCTMALDSTGEACEERQQHWRVKRMGLW